MTLFLSSSAGVWKTTLTQCLYEALDNQPGENPGELKATQLTPDTRQEDNITITNYMQTQTVKRAI